MAKASTLIMTMSLLIILLLYTVSLIWRRWLALSYANSKPPLPLESLPEGTLTINQAILSGDPLLESRLEANLDNLPGQNFLWLIDEDDAEALRIAGKQKRPQIRVVLCPPCPDATNPKLWKLQIASRLVQTPFFAVIDDDTSLSAASASALVEAARTSTVATGLPCYQNGQNLASCLLGQFVNNNSIFTYLGTSRLLSPFTLNGMGYVMRREELDRIQHFHPILHELTDDFALATLVLKLGGSINQSQAPLYVQTGVRDMKHYFQMMHRWNVFTLLLLKGQSIPVQLLIFVLHGLPPMLLGFSFLLLAVVSWQILLIILCFYFILVSSLRSPLITVLLSSLALLTLMWIRGEPTSCLLLIVMLLRRSSLASIQRMFFCVSRHQPLMSLFSELIQPLHLSHALFSRTISWRMRRYWVRDTNDFSAV
ncbi:glycosyltransferase [Synechococcus sp. CBW1004]|uniref:glycosyltransferase n=1 Tax=Synechococcus sp. CBW1004 TaxID=1353136 RepID=UPI0018CF0A06|nr:glycosyltransferase family 2 protein [Synechococcus sp. CBW1004]QPN64038.1 glycosyltransferase family 2 protein [Synechococcus sp. CBW1004]